jgi:uncharacterized protein (TIGR02145 family)
MRRIITILGLTLCYITCYSQETGKFEDLRDGKIYSTVIIGKQTWMAENLAYEAPGGCWPNKDIQGNLTYGFLYNWETAKKVCPAGWHLPTDAQWTSLKNYLGGNNKKNDISGGKLKEAGTINWKSPNTGATNESGFTALPGGFIVNDTCKDVGYEGGWWSSNEMNLSLMGNQDENLISGAATYSLSNSDAKFRTILGIKNHGYSVRCLKD